MDLCSVLYTTRQASLTDIPAHTSPIFSCFSAASILVLADWQIYAE